MCFANCLWVFWFCWFLVKLQYGSTLLCCFCWRLRGVFPGKTLSLMLNSLFVQVHFREKIQILPVKRLLKGLHLVFEVWLNSALTTLRSFPLLLRSAVDIRLINRSEDVRSILWALPLPVNHSEVQVEYVQHVWWVNDVTFTILHNCGAIIHKSTSTHVFVLTEFVMELRSAFCRNTP